MSSVPRFSVVIPTFERNDSVGRMLDILAPGAQTLAPEHYEVIVSDAGVRSTAQAMLSERYPWARWIGAPGAAPGRNRNTGARAARGEWLVFVDDDCRPGPAFLAGYHEMAVNGLHDVLEGRITCIEKAHLPFRRQIENLAGGMLITGNLAVRRDVFFRIGPFDEDLGRSEDLEFGSRLRASGQRIAFCAAASLDHPSQPMGGRQIWQKTFERRWFVLLRYKTGEAPPLDTPTFAALAQLTREEVLCLLRVIWHLFSRHDRLSWRNRWLGTMWTVSASPLVIPCLWFWEVHYRRRIREGSIRLRPMPGADDVEPVRLSNEPQISGCAAKGLR